LELSKPRFYVLKWGPVKVFKSQADIDQGLESIADIVKKYPQLRRAKQNSYSASSTVGLVQYDTPNGTKYMITDLGLSADWPKITDSMNKIGCKLDDITHILQTHWDEDHFENITRLPYRLCIWGGTGPHYHPVPGHILVTGTNIYVQTQDIYPDGYVEDPNIRYYFTYRAHSRDEMYFVINTENEGKVAFVGDLIHYPRFERPDTSDHLYLDRTYTLNIFRKYSNLKDIHRNHPDLNKVFAGHASAPMSYKDLENYIAMLESKDYLEFQREYLNEWKKTLAEYEDVLNKNTAKLSRSG
jgi:glyoxylase-like metal-dependent hydrolase (beta-lactamase superfamily II)